MHIPRPSQETEELFRTLVPDAPGVQVKPMFANLGAFVNGNMFAGLFGDTIGVRLPDESVRAELLAVE
jgi:TfoX/Sxy family transcriptional regulator of competence genes